MNDAPATPEPETPAVVTVPIWTDGVLDTERLRKALASRARRSIRIEGFRESAVLVPLVFPPGGEGEGVIIPAPELLFIVRQAGLPTHAGQIAFPGGKREPDDASLEETALRESDEELGLRRASVDVLGRLDDVPTPAGFVITPVVGVVRGPIELLLQGREVAESFYAPLPVLPGIYRAGGEREWLGHRYQMHEFLHGERRIWGATATIVYELLHIVGAAREPQR